jgi:hypothetical protein
VFGEHWSQLAVVIAGQANKCLAAILQAVPSECTATKFQPLSNSHDCRYFAAVQHCRKLIGIGVGRGGLYHHVYRRRLRSFSGTGDEAICEAPIRTTRLSTGTESGIDPRSE